MASMAVRQMSSRWIELRRSFVIRTVHAWTIWTTVRVPDTENRLGHFGRAKIRLDKCPKPALKQAKEMLICSQTIN